MSSHREAPEISKDPVADNTDTYAFVSPDKPDTVTIITNYIPLEDPAGGPNFFEFGDDVLYRINIDNDGDGRPDVHLRVPVQDHGHEPEHVPVQHRSDHGARQPQLQPAPDLLGHRGPQEPPAAQARRQPDARRRATSALGRRRTTRTWRTPRSTSSPTTSWSSPGSGSTASSSTSARCSTSPRCGRSRTCT